MHQLITREVEEENMKSRSMKKFMRKAVSAVSAVAMAIMLAAPAVSTQAFAADGKAANSVTYIGKNTIKTYDGKSLTYDSSVTFTTKNSDGSYSELSLADAKTAVKDGQEVKVYTKAHAEGYGSVWSESYDYTNYRTGVQIGEDSDVAIGTEGVGGKLTGTLLENFNLVSTSKNFNPIVVNKSDATIKGATIVAGNADGKDNSDGRNDINDFVGYGTAVNIYGDSVTTGGGADANGQMGGTTETNATYKTTIDMTEGGSITTYGVARPAVAVDNGGDVVIKGDGNDKTQEISVNGGTLYDGFKNTADTVKMVSPPWVLGVVGNSRATNMLGKGSTMVVQDADVYAKSWGALSTDSGSNPFLYAINSNISMDTTSDDASGYGTYAIGNAQEYFLGSTFNVPTYLTIAANGDNNNITLGATKKGQKITTQKAVWKDNVQSIIDYGTVTASETRETVVNSENFGVDIWGQATVNVNVSASFGGGIGRMRETCGAACGMFLLAGLEKCAIEGKDRESKAANYALVQELAEEFKKRNGALRCADLLGLSGKEPVVSTPEARTERYYAKRPCARMVEEAARIWSEHLEKQKNRLKNRFFL